MGLNVNVALIHLVEGPGDDIILLFEDPQDKEIIFEKGPWSLRYGL